MIDVREIIARIPHRFPMLLIDRVLEIEPGQRGVGIKCVSINEPYFQGHFQDYPIVPGVLITESLAQLAAVVFSEDNNSNEDRPGFLAQVNMRYRQPVKPGDVMKLEISLIKKMGRCCKVKAIASVDDKIVANGEMTFS
ncbi:MAG: 3-hydroxyacyl-ACP dehydratase FabZ [Halanaerobiales bacterium]|nr:3-hydroxyacyl-ACP dehydratase FabZ [Halanaerobiales bacterium]